MKKHTLTTADKLNMKYCSLCTDHELVGKIKYDLVVVFTTACCVTGLSLQELKSKNRNRRITDNRSFAMRYMFDLGFYSLTSIGKAFNKDHTTVIYSVRKVSELSTVDDQFKKDYNDFKTKMNNILYAA